MWSGGPSEALGCVPTPPEDRDGRSTGTSGIEGIPPLLWYLLLPQSRGCLPGMLDGIEPLFNA